MNREKRAAPEEHAEKNCVTDWGQMVPSFYTSLPGKQREPVKDRVDQVNVTDWQTATYWG